MKTKYVYENVEYTFSNENLKVGDKVFPISRGKVTDDKFEHWEFDFRDFMCGFPDEPHIILDLHHSNYKPYQSRTDHGYSPIECYFKIIEKKILI